MKRVGAEAQRRTTEQCQVLACVCAITFTMRRRIGIIESSLIRVEPRRFYYRNPDEEASRWRDVLYRMTDFLADFV